MAQLVLGPVLRYADAGVATVWVETDVPCEVEVLGCRERTLCIEEHHYALVHVTGFETGVPHEYEVRLNGEKRWPEGDFPPSAIRTMAPGEPLKIVFGSCRISAPHEPPYTLSGEEDERGLGVDALYALAMWSREKPAERLPHALVLLGDQVYAHKPPQDTIEYIRSQRDTERPPGEVVASFREYARLYRDSWGDPAIRWLLSTVPSVMIFDDHEVGDDWNLSEAWVEEMRMEPWWDEQIIGGLMSYWIYQHLGNLSPGEFAAEELLQRARATPDAAPLLREFARRAHRETAGSRWSFHRDFGDTRLVMVDSRAGRVLESERRSMVDDSEWAWVEEHATGGFKHLLIGTSLPVLLPPATHYLEAASEAVCSGIWGRRAARWSERLRRWQDLEHWSAFNTSFVRLTELIRAVAAGERGRPPASVIVLSGDVHHTYLAQATFRHGKLRSPVYQAVCSPLRNSLPREKRLLQSLGWTKPAILVGRLLSRLASVGEPEVSWSLAHRRPWFETHVATLTLSGPRATLKFERAVSGGSGKPGLEKLEEFHLT